MAASVRMPARIALLAAILMTAADPGLLAQTAAPNPATAWTLGLARFGLASADDTHSSLQESIPRLIAADLADLPTRSVPDAATREMAAREDLRARFLAGSDLSSKLDARSARFLDPSLDGAARKDELSKAEAQVAASAKKLSDLDSAAPKPGVGPSVPRTAKLWDGHAKGQLIDTPASGLAAAAKAAGVDLLVTGTLALKSGYAVVQIRGFDAALEREAFSWKSFCAVDDPAPLVSDIAVRLERWVAGRDFARLELRVAPAFAALSVDGVPKSAASPVVYAYADGRHLVEASASGYAARRVDVDLALGERKTVDIELERLDTGKVYLSVDPPGAAISLDSVPIGKSPIEIQLSGARGIATATAPGREPQSVVLPASGESSLDIRLLPSDGLGPSGRIGAEKDHFFQSLGWFVLSLPPTFLTWGARSGYDDAYLRTGNESLLLSDRIATGAMIAAIAATGATAAVMVVRLVKYLGVAH